MFGAEYLEWNGGSGQLGNGGRDRGRCGYRQRTGALRDLPQELGLARIRGDEIVRICVARRRVLRRLHSVADVHERPP